MNKGIIKSQGEWLYFLGSGDLLENSYVLESVFSKVATTKSSLISGKVIYQGETSPFIYNKTKVVKKPIWNFSIWLRNGLHHQGTFYKKELFTNTKYSLKYPIFSDYWFHLLLFKNGHKCLLIDFLIAKCNSDGISKKGDLVTYKEEVVLKTALTNTVMYPFFYILVFIKFSLRKILNG